MAVENMTDAEVAAKARAIYAEQIRPFVEPTHDGEFIVINIETGEYEVGPNDLEVSRRASARFGDAVSFVTRVGRRTAYRLGSYSRVGP